MHGIGGCRSWILPREEAWARGGGESDGTRLSWRVRITTKSTWHGTSVASRCNPRWRRFGLASSRDITNYDKCHVDTEVTRLSAAVGGPRRDGDLTSLCALLRCLRLLSFDLRPQTPASIDGCGCVLDMMCGSVRRGRARWKPAQDSARHPMQPAQFGALGNSLPPCTGIVCCSWLPSVWSGCRLERTNTLCHMWPTTEQQVWRSRAPTGQGSTRLKGPWRLPRDLAAPSDCSLRLLARFRRTIASLVSKTTYPDFTFQST